MDLQPANLQNELIKLVPLKTEHLESLYQVASDPLIWEQHPNKTRHLREVFESFFSHAIESKGAFAVTDRNTGDLIGSTRFYDLDENNKTVLIGYTFLARTCWGKPFNKSVKSVMLDHAFEYVDTVIFHIGAGNIRSQKAIQKLGAEKIGEEQVTYAGEAQANLNYIYEIKKVSWQGQPRLIRML